MKDDNSRNKILEVMMTVVIIALILLAGMNIIMTNSMRVQLAKLQNRVSNLETQIRGEKTSQKPSDESESDSYQGDQLESESAQGVEMGFVKDSDSKNQAGLVTNIDTGKAESTKDSELKGSEGTSETETKTGADGIEHLPDTIDSVLNIEPGTVLDESKVDGVNIGRYFTENPIVPGDEVYDRIIDKSYRPNEDIALEELRYIKLIHRNFDGKPQVGELIVNAAISKDIIEIFTELYLKNYQVCSMHLVDDYWTGDGESSDANSIDHDNTSAFCYRFSTGSGSNLSNHAYGCAIDLNPRENPYVKVHEDGSRTTYHDNAQEYKDNRSSATPHVIDENDLAYQLFTEHGFEWGGHWQNPIDYQHFQKPLY